MGDPSRCRRCGARREVAVLACLGAERLSYAPCAACQPEILREARLADEAAAAAEFMASASVPEIDALPRWVESYVDRVWRVTDAGGVVSVVCGGPESGKTPIAAAWVRRMAASGRRALYLTGAQACASGRDDAVREWSRHFAVAIDGLGQDQMTLADWQSQRMARLLSEMKAGSVLITTGWRKHQYEHGLGKALSDRLAVRSCHLDIVRGGAR